MIGFKALRAVIAELHGEGVTPTSLLGRFKYFQRMSFPGGSNVGSGSRAAYSLSQVLALAMAFELQETAASPVRVVRLLRHQWPEIERAIISSWARLEGRGGAALLIAHSPAALIEMGLADDENRPPVDALKVMSAAQVVGWLEDSKGLGAPSVYLIDLSRFVRQFGAAMLASGHATAEDLEREFNALAAEAFGTSDSARWAVADHKGTDDLRSSHRREGL